MSVLIDEELVVGLFENNGLPKENVDKFVFSGDLSSISAVLDDDVVMTESF